MRLLHAFIGLALMFALTASTDAADKAKKKGGVAGEVTAIQKDEGKDTGSITLKTIATKKNAGAAGEEKKFTISESTKFEKAPAKVKGQKAAKGAPGTPATFADLKQGNTVTVAANGTTADKVVIGGAKKKKAK